MKRKYASIKNTLHNIEEKISLWKHAFGNCEYIILEKVVSNFDIVALDRKLSTEEALKLNWVYKDNIYLLNCISCSISYQQSVTPYNAKLISNTVQFKT